MKKIILFLFLTVFCFFVEANAATCFPKNNITNPVGLKSTNTISEEEFKSSIELVKSIYEPIFKEKYEAQLIVEEKWQDATINAYASQSGKQWKVAMFGGLARDPEVTKDGFIAVICHEIGHHVAGAPRKMFTWASNEGQADYYATTKCLRKVYEKELDQTLKIYYKKDLSEDEQFAKTACQKVYKSKAEKAVCFRSALAGQSLARLLGKLGGTPDVKFTTPDQMVVAKTNHNHPKGQCRMDTYFQGALCDVDHNVWPSAQSASEGYCTKKDNFSIGLRPVCWFNPKEYEVE